MLLGWKLVDCLPPEPCPFDFPHFGAVIGVFDAIALPIFLGEHGRVSRKIIDSAADIGFANSWNAAGSAVFWGLWCCANDFRWVQPTMEITGYFANESLAKSVQIIKKLRVSPVKFVERPRTNADAIAAIAC